MNITAIDIPVTTLPVPATEVNPFALKSKYDGLKERFGVLAEAVESAFSAEEKGSVDHQRDLLVALADCKLLEHLFKTAEQTWNGIDLSALDPTKITNDFIKDLSELAKELVEVVIDQLGVTGEAVLPAVMTDLEHQVELIEQIINRAERYIGINHGARTFENTAKTIDALPSAE